MLRRDPTISPAAVPRRTLGRQTAALDDHLFVLDPSTGRFSVLSPSAALVYATVDGSSSVAEIAASIAEETGLTDAELRADIQTAMASMQAEDLISFTDQCVATSTGAEPPSMVAPVPSRSAPPADQVAVPPGAVRIGPLQVGAASVVVLLAAPELVALLEGPLRLLPSSETTEVPDACLVVSRADDGRYDVRLDEGSVATADTAAAAADAVLATCNRIASTRSAGAVRLHGGAVARDGRAVAFCGRSGAGKSTLVAALVQQGWGYLTDEVVIVDASTLTVTAYPKWVDLTPDAVQRLGYHAGAAIGPAGRKLHLPPSSIGPVGDSAQLAAIVLLDHDAPAMNDPVGVLSAPEAVQALLGNAFAETFDHDDGLTRVVKVCAGVPVAALGRRGLDSMTAAVDEFLTQLVEAERI